MFGFMKKHNSEKEAKKEKEKKEKKEKKKDKPMTNEELQRLEEAKKLYRHASDASAMRPSNSSGDSRERTPDTNAGTIFTSSAQIDVNQPYRLPPPTQPKPKKGILKEKSHYGPEIPNQGVRGNLDDTLTLEENTHANENLLKEAQKNGKVGSGESDTSEGDQKAAEGKGVNRRGSVKQMAGVFESVSRSGPPKKPVSLSKPKSLPTKHYHKPPPPLPDGSAPSNESPGSNELDQEIPPTSHALPSPTEKIYENVNLQLPSIAPPRSLKPRKIILPRKPAGDFGMSLRKGTILERGLTDHIERKRTVIFAEPSPNNTKESGLLPGDRLIEVNGRNVENISREEMIDIIKASGTQVELTVQPIPELSELSMRSGLEGEDVSIVEQSVQSGTLQRTGSVRYKASQTRSEENLAEDKAWSKAECVWLVHQGGFTAAKMMRGTPGEGDATKVKVKLERSGDELEVDEDDVETANPPKFDRVEDVSALRYINESSILHSLRQRYGSNLIHTYAGRSLIVINPMHPLSIYSEKVIHMFRGCRAEDMPPHIYATAQLAYRGVINSRRDQSVVLMGRSGSGKSSSLRHLLHFYAVAVNSVNNLLTVDKMNSVFTLLDAFGNSRTSLNTSATRHTCQVCVDLDNAGQIAAVNFQAMMLEKTRLFRRREGEPTFHIFYQMLSGVDENLKKELQLDHPPEDNAFCTPLHKPDDQRKAMQAWSAVLQSFTKLGAQDGEVRAVVATLAAIFHLGAAGVSKGVNNKYQFARPVAAQRAAAALGLSVEELNRAVFQSSPSQLSPKSTFSRGGGDKSPSGPEEVSGREALESFVCGLYAEGFNAVLGIINRSLSSPARSSCTIYLLDSPGFQAPGSATGNQPRAASFTDLCHNYVAERLQLLHHELMFTASEDLYAQENVNIEMEPVQGSPAPIVALLDKPSQQSLVRAGGSPAGRDKEDKGLLWVLDDEAITPGSSDEHFASKVAVLHSHKKNPLLSKSAGCDITIQHMQGSCPVTYNCTGWLKACRENPASKTTNQVLTESRRENISQLYQTFRSAGSVSLVSGSVAGIDAGGPLGGTLRRSASMRRSHTTGGMAGLKKRSLCVQLKFTMDAMIENLRKTQVHFVHCLLPQAHAGLSAGRSGDSEDVMINVPLLRAQVRGAEILPSVRMYKQGYPETVSHSDFLHRYQVLVDADKRPDVKLNKKQAVQKLLDALEVEKTYYVSGESLVFFRAGYLAQLDEQRESLVSDSLILFQAQCRGLLSRRRLETRKRQWLAVRCIQRNVLKFLSVRDWPWWKLYTRVRPLLDVHRTEDLLKEAQTELEALKTKYAKVDKERTEYKVAYDQLDSQYFSLMRRKVSDMRADLAEEATTSNQASELLESEQSERMRLEKELSELQAKYSHLERKHSSVEMELYQTRMIASQLDAEMEEEEGDASMFKERFERLKREMLLQKKKLEREREEDSEHFEHQKKHLEKKVTEAMTEAEERERQVGIWRKKVTKANQELADVRRHLEEQSVRNTELEKKQRKFDFDISKINDQLKETVTMKDKIQHERDELMAAKYSVEKESSSKSMDIDVLKEKIQRLESELSEVSSAAADKKELVTVMRQKAELERKSQDQELELDEQAGTIQQLEQLKLKLEMDRESVRKQHLKELEEKETELEELRSSTQKRLKSMEAQLEEAYDEKQSMVKEKRELERKMKEVGDIAPQINTEIERRLRRDLKRTKAMLVDAQRVLDKQKEGSSTKATVKQLKSQLEDAEFVSSNALRARRALEEELEDLQQRSAETSRAKMETDNKVAAISREKADLAEKIEELEEEVAEITKKYKNAISQQQADRVMVQEQSKLLEELGSEKQALQESVSQLESRLSFLQATTVDKQTLVRAEGKVREMEGRLDLEETTRHKAENHVNRLKDQLEKATEERDRANSEISRIQENEKRLERKIRELKDDNSELERKESDASSKKLTLEKKVEALDEELAQAQSDLRLAFKRIENLQAAMEDDMMSSADSDFEGLDGLSDDDSDDDFTQLTRTTRASSYSSAKSSNEPRATSDFDDSTC